MTSLPPVRPLMTRRSQTAAAAAAATATDSKVGIVGGNGTSLNVVAVTKTTEPKQRATPIVFTDTENLVVAFLVAQYEETITNTACTGPARDEKDRVWELISKKLRRKLNGTTRTPEQVRARWKSMRSSYTFRENKTQQLAQMYYNRIRNTDHTVRYTDVTVPTVKPPTWLAALIKGDPLMREGGQLASNPVVLTPSLKRPSTNPTTVSKKKSKPEAVHRPHLVPQDAILDHHSPSESTSEQREYNSVTESAGHSPADSYFDEADALHRRRREEELHSARIALLNAQRKEIEARTRYMDARTARLQTSPLVESIQPLRPLEEEGSRCQINRSPSQLLQDFADVLNGSLNLP